MPTAASLYENDLAILDHKVQTYAYHPMIDQYLDNKPFSPMRQHMVFLMLRQAHVDRESALSIATSYCLVEMGMAVHDEVHPIYRDSDNLKVRQIQVLAGDFYSSQYYSLLSDLEDTELVQRLSDAICQINLYKLTQRMHHDQQTLSYELYKELTLSQRASLFESLTNKYYLDRDAHIWNTLFKTLLWVEWLGQELEFPPKGTKAKGKALIFKYQIQTRLRSELQQALASVQADADKLGNPTVSNEVEFMLRPHLGFLSNPVQVAEEM